jgi:hypothetical protein
MMESKLNLILEKNLRNLVEFLLEINSNVNKDLLNQKINTLFKINIGKVNNNPKSKKILDSIFENKPIIKVKKSLFSNYVLFVEETDTRFEDIRTNNFVMDLSSQTIVGLENSQGEIEPLNKDLIEICHKYKLKYKIPLNLDTNIDQDIIINEIQELGLNYAGSDEENED